MVRKNYVSMELVIVALTEDTIRTSEWAEKGEGDFFGVDD